MSFDFNAILAETTARTDANRNVLTHGDAAVRTALEEQLRQAFPFDIEKRRLQGPAGEATPHCGLFRTDTGACLPSAVSERYTPHGTDDVVALAEAASVGLERSGHPIDAADVRAHFTSRGEHFVSIGPRPDGEHNFLAPDAPDTIFPRAIIRAGCGSSAFTATLGIYRTRCSNLAVFGVQTERTVKLRHTSKLREHMPELVSEFQGLASGWDGVVREVEELQEARIDLAALLGQLYPDPGPEATTRARNAARRRSADIVARLMRERRDFGAPEGIAKDSTEVSAWEAYNAVQGFVQHDKNRRGDVTTNERAEIALRDTDVAKATEVIYEMVAAAN